VRRFNSSALASGGLSFASSFASRLPAAAYWDEANEDTHVNGTARIQTISFESNRSLYELLVAFKARTGYGVLCNTSLNFNGRGFINKIKDLSVYAMEHNLDGFVVEGRAYLLKGSGGYRTYLKRPNCLSATFSL
jgi:predicted NodU family carbamoyl transferase